VLCPTCGGETRVVDSRAVPSGVRRRRVCAACQHRFSTIETELPLETRVGKSRGRPAEPFQPEKILRVLQRISKDGALNSQGINEVVLAVVRRIRANHTTFVESGTIAAIVAEILEKKSPRVALRFLANYDGASPDARSIQPERADSKLTLQRDLPF
jgi:transcriptional repressor NrdR